jgi:thiamine transport system permease protein
MRTGPIAAISPRIAAIAALVVSAAPLAAVILSVQPSRLVAALAGSISDRRTFAILGFTVMQATLSCLLSLAFGLPGAWLYARFRFPGRRLLMALSALPFCVPPVLVILAFVLYFGNAGIVHRVIESIAGKGKAAGTSFLYSFGGIVLVHAFYNFPVIVQIVGGTWSRIPTSREDAARVLGAGGFRAFLTGTLPSLGPAIGQAASLVFLFCFFSFSVVLVFGGFSGSTLEVEVYRKARLEADPAGAAAIALLETLIALSCVAVFSYFERRTAAGTGRGGSRGEALRPRGFPLLFLALYGIFLALFFLGPILALLVQAFSLSSGWDRFTGFGTGNFRRLLSGSPPPLLRAMAGSFATAVPASILATAAGIALAYSRLLLVEREADKDGKPWRMPGERAEGGGVLAVFRRIGRGIAATPTALPLDLAGSLPLALSGVVTSLGWVLLFPAGGAFPVIMAQATMAFPFVFRGISGAFSSLERNPRSAARSLGANPITVFLTVDIPGAAPAILASAAFAFSMAIGDVNAPLLLGSGDFLSLPLLLYRLVASYRFPEACAVGLVLAALTGFVFFLKERTSDGA